MPIRYSEKAANQLRKIAKGDKRSAQKIIESIEKLIGITSENLDLKVLKGKYGDLKRLRVGHYRIIFSEESDMISILEIKHRQEAYHD